MHKSTIPFRLPVRISCIILFIFLRFVPVYAQPGNEAGLPMITNYSPKEFNAPSQVWSIVEDTLGIMYFGLSTGLLEYDGVKWQTIRFANPDFTSVIRVMAKDQDGRIYYGAIGDFGYLSKDSLGQTFIQSLLHLIPEKERNFYDIWSIQITPEGIYYQSREKIIRINKDNEVKIWKPQTMFMYTFYLDNTLFVHEQTRGLYKLISDTLRLIPGSEFIGQERMQVMLPYPSVNNQKNYLLGLFFSGIYLFNGHDFKKLKTEADDIFNASTLYRGMILPDSTYALCTSGQGLVIMDKNGRSKGILNREIGLQDESVYNLYYDSKDFLWLSLDNGISKVEMSSPFSFFGIQSGINTSVLNVIRFEDHIFLGTTNGVLKYNPVSRKFSRIKDIPGNQVFTLMKDRDQLLILTEGIYACKKGKIKAIRKSVGGDMTSTTALISKKHPGMMLVAHIGGLAAFYRDPSNPGSEWVFIGNIEGFDEQVWSLEEDDMEDGKFWAGTQSSKAFLFSPAFASDGKPDIKRFHFIEYSEKDGWEKASGTVYSIKNRPVFIGDSAIFLFDHQTKKFVVDDRFGKFPNGGGREQADIVENGSGSIWIRFGKETFLATPQSDGKYKVDNTPFLPLNEHTVSKIYPETGQITWIATTDGLLRFDSRNLKNYDKPFNTVIRSMTTGRKKINPDSIGSGNQRIEISYANNSVRFEYASLFFDQEKRTEYQTWLEGFEDDWSEWDVNHYKEYTNLPAGKYVFHVRAKNIYRKLSREDTFSFTILPPWYGSLWAYILYAFIAITLIYLIVRQRTKHLHEKHRELEKEVSERTHQLSQRVEELAVINSVQQSLVSEKDINSIYEMVGEKIRKIFDAQVLDIVAYDAMNNLVEDKYAFEKGDRTLLGPHEPNSFRKQVIQSGETLVINKDVEKISREKNISVQIGEVPKSLVIVPMISGGRVTGMISLQDLDKENAFPDSSVNLLKTLANSMSVALESAERFDETKRLLRETEQRNAELAVINSVQDGLVREMKMQGIYDLVGEKIREIFNAQVIDIVMYEPKSNTIEDRYAYEKGDRSLIGAREPKGFRKHVINKMQPLFINSNYEEMARQFNNEVIFGETPKSLAMVPMIAGNEVKGIISLQNLDRENAFTESDHSLLTTLANSMTVALESARLFDETTRLLQETEQRNAELAVINSVQEGLVAHLDMQEIYDLVGEKIREIFNAQVIDIVTYDPKSNLIEDRYAYEKGDRTLLGPRTPKGFRQHVIQTRQLLLHNENVIEESKRFGNEVLIGDIAKSQVFVPMIAGGEVKGVISLQNLDFEHAFKESDIRLLTTLANSMTVALENARLFDQTSRLLKETEQRNAELAVINSVQDGLVAQLDIQNIYDLVGEKIREIFNAQVIDIVTYDPGKNIIEDRYSYEKGDRTLVGPRSPNGFRKHVIQTKQLLMINENSIRAAKEYNNPVVIGDFPKSLLFVPMIAGTEVKGIISLQNIDHENAFQESDARLLTTLANSMSVALESARLFDETKRLLHETEQRTAELAVINTVQEGLVREIDANAIYYLVGEKMREIFNAQIIDIVTYDKSQNIIEDRYTFEKGDRTLMGPREPFGYRKHVIDNQQIIVINEDAERKAIEYGNKVLVGEMTKSAVFVPLLEGNEVTGIVSLQNADQENAFSDSDIRLLVTLANSLSIALQNARLFDETKRLLRETEQRTAELAVINSVQEGLVREIDAKAIYEMVGEKMREIFDSQVIDIVTYDPQTNIIEDRYSYEKGDRTLLGPRAPHGFRKYVIESKQVLLHNSNVAQASVDFNNPVLIGEMPKSQIFVPMFEGNEVSGIVSIQNLDKENAFSESDERLLITLSNSLSIALKNARLFEETRRLLAESKQRAAELSTVNSVSKALAAQLNPDELIEIVGNQMKDLFSANIVYLALLNKKTNTIHFPYQFGDNLVPMKLGEGLTSQILITGEPLLLNTELEGSSTPLGFQRVGLPAASYLGVPIPDGDEIIGVLSVQSTEQENRFNENDQRLLSTIAASVGVALRNARLFEEVKLAKLEAETASRVAEKANEAKSAFLSTVSHELRTPLTSVLGFAKIIRKRLEDKIFPATDKSDPKTEKTIQQISENLNVVISEGERLTHLINDVLDLAKIEAGKMEWNMGKVSMSEVVERAASATSALFDQKGLHLEKQFDPDLPDIQGDHDKLIQVVVNLLSNAVKFTEQGSVSCRVYLRGNDIVTQVTDTGIGIAEEDHNAVFEQFKQVGDTLTDKPKGTGLGLPICKEIVEHHGGRIWLESAPGKGSTFYFSIPVNISEVIRPVPLDELVQQLKEQMSKSQLSIQGRNATILIVDDDDSIRSLLYQELSEAGYFIEEATNGREALARVRTNRPDLVILDIMMPEMNGFDVAAILKNDPQTMDIPIIVLSIVQDKARGYRIGVDRYLTKPIDTGRLFSEVDILLQQGKSRKKVMVVDEDYNTVRTLVDVLQAKGYQVVESDGKELMQKAIDTQPDIIILNSILSDSNGITQTLRMENGLENVLFLVYQ